MCPGAIHSEPSPHQLLPASANDGKYTADTRKGQIAPAPDRDIPGCELTKLPKPISVSFVSPGLWFPSELRLLTESRFTIMQSGGSPFARWMVSTGAHDPRSYGRRTGVGRKRVPCHCRKPSGDAWIHHPYGVWDIS